MNTYLKVVIGAAVGAGAYWMYRMATVPSQIQITNLENEASTYSYNITDPNNMSDPNVQGYMHVWNQLSAAPGGTSLPSLAQMQASYNASNAVLPQVTGS